jgi:hypothetical protein
MEISALDFFLINILSYIGGLGTGLLVCCKHKDKFMNNNNNTREHDHFQISQPYTPPPQADVIASAPPPEQINKGVRITLE